MLRVGERWEANRVKGCINKTNITKYSRRHLRYFSVRQRCPDLL